MVTAVIIVRVIAITGTTILIMRWGWHKYAWGVRDMHTKF
jgi:hypothetical protein